MIYIISVYGMYMQQWGKSRFIVSIKSGYRFFTTNDYNMGFIRWLNFVIKFKMQSQ